MLQPTVAPNINNLIITRQQLRLLVQHNLSLFDDEFGSITKIFEHGYDGDITEMFFIIISNSVKGIDQYRHSCMTNDFLDNYLRSCIAQRIFRYSSNTMFYNSPTFEVDYEELAIGTAGVLDKITIPELRYQALEIVKNILISMFNLFNIQALNGTSYAFVFSQLHDGICMTYCDSTLLVNNLVQQPIYG